MRCPVCLQLFQANNPNTAHGWCARCHADLLEVRPDLRESKP